MKIFGKKEEITAVGEHRTTRVGRTNFLIEATEEWDYNESEPHHRLYLAHADYTIKLEIYDMPASAFGTLDDFLTWTQRVFDVDDIRHETKRYKQIIKIVQGR